MGPILEDPKFLVGASIGATGYERLQDKSIPCVGVVLADGVARRILVLHRVEVLNPDDPTENITEMTKEQGAAN